MALGIYVVVGGAFVTVMDLFLTGCVRTCSFIISKVCCDMGSVRALRMRIISKSGGCSKGVVVPRIMSFHSGRFGIINVKIGTFGNYGVASIGVPGKM